MKKMLTYTPEQVATVAGVTRRTVYNWIMSGKLPAHKVGPKCWHVYRGVLSAFLGGRDAQQAAADIAARVDAEARNTHVQTVTVKAAETAESVRDLSGRPRPGRPRRTVAEVEDMERQGDLAWEQVQEEIRQEEIESALMQLPPDERAVMVRMIEQAEKGILPLEPLRLHRSKRPKKKGRRR